MKIFSMHLEGPGQQDLYFVSYTCIPMGVSYTCIPMGKSLKC